MKLSLLVQVYNGGDYWRECWESVLRNQDLFEQIYVSIGKSPKQDEDLLQFTASDIFRNLLAITSANDILHF